MKPKIYITIVILTISAATQIAAQNIPPIPVDSAVRYGQLQNGLTYYIRHNTEPKNRCEFHIAQAVGAILEEDNQNGLAHFLEHMAFNGTEHFQGKGIIDYFESIGLNFGENINAYTSIDETVYRLSDVPTIREGIIDSALLVLHDWSCGLLLSDKEIEAERGVICEEWRTRANASRRMWKISNAQKYPDSQYAKRDIIGDTAIINNFEHETLRNYYKKWYGPDLQAIIVVGDIDVDTIEKKIKNLWDTVLPRTNRGERPLYTIVDNEKPIVSIVKDKEAQKTTIEVIFKHDPVPDKIKNSIIGYVQELKTNLILTILNERFAEIKQQPDASFVKADNYYGKLVKTKDAFELVSIPKEGQEKQALQDMLIEIERLKRYGFTLSEIERAKTNLLKCYEKAYNERNNIKNRALTQKYIRHFLDKESIPNIAWEYQIAQSVMPQITLDDLNKLVQNLITDKNIIVAISAPEKETVIIPSKEEIINLLNTTKKLSIDAKKDEKIDRPLVEKTPKSGKIKSIKNNTSLGTTEWILNNGIRIIIKPTQFKQDEILMTADSKGGLSKIKKQEDLPSAHAMTDIIDYNGIGTFSSIELKKNLTGKIVDVSPKINQYFEGLSGYSSAADFDTMLQLIYLYFTAPRRDDKAFQSLINLYKTFLINKETNPKAIFSDSVQQIMSSHHPRIILINNDFVSKIDQNRALALYKERFAVPADFIFTFTGNIDPNDTATQKSICKWLGGLKSKKQKESSTDRGIRSPIGIKTNLFTREMQTKTATNGIIYTGNMPYTLTNILNMQAIANILDIRYLESIREKEGGSYGVGVWASVEKEPIEQASLQMQFDTDPQKQQKLIGIIHQEIEELIKNGPRADDLQKTKENMLKNFAENIEKNSWWNSALYLYYMRGFNLPEDYKNTVQSISTESIQTTLSNLVKQGNMTEIIMLPAQ